MHPLSVHGLLAADRRSEQAQSSMLRAHRYPLGLAVNIEISARIAMHKLPTDASLHANRQTYTPGVRVQISTLPQMAELRMRLNSGGRPAAPANNSMPSTSPGGMSSMLKPTA
jgi:hypothetical protein